MGSVYHVVELTDQVAITQHGHIVCKDHVGDAVLLSKGNKIAIPVAIVDFVDGAIVVNEIRHHCVTKGFLDHDTSRAIGDVGIGEFCRQCGSCFTGCPKRRYTGFGYIQKITEIADGNPYMKGRILWLL